MGLIEQVRDAGVVGEGGAGFPTHVKISAKVDTVIANGAECEPLLYTDQVIMERHPRDVLEGLSLVMKSCGATRGVLAFKAVYKEVSEAFERYMEDFPKIEIFLLDNFYPSGDEQTLVCEVTERVVPEGGIPLAVGVVVSNVGTLRNVYRASKSQPVTHKYVTLNGEVANPGVYYVPVGITLEDLLGLAGGPTLENYKIVSGGPMMGSLVEDLQKSVTKTTGAFIVLPERHPIVNSLDMSIELDMRRTLSVCCQCRYCTDLCPRYALGHRCEPHKWMRAVYYGDGLDSPLITQAHLCCLCNICEVWSCPLGLSPKKVAEELKMRLGREKIQNPYQNRPDSPMDFYSWRKVPKTRLLSRLSLGTYEKHLEFISCEVRFSTIILPLKQHIGAPSVPVVQVGDMVKAKQRVAEIPERALGSMIISPVDGKVVQVDNENIIIEPAHNYRPF